MKKLIVFLISIITWDTVLYAQTNEIKEREIPLQVLKDIPRSGRSISSPTVHAIICDKVVTIMFENSISNSTITIISITTGKIIYSKTSNNPTSLNIDLSEENDSYYLINIEVDNIYLEGNFSL